MNTHPAWTRLLEAARRRQATRADQAAEAPFGFATRLAAEARRLRAADQRLALWQRAAWRGALASAAVCLAVFASHWSPSPTEPLLLPPAIEVPLP